MPGGYLSFGIYQKLGGERESGAMLTRTSRSLRTLRAPASCVACVPEAQGSCCATVRTPYAYEPRVCLTFRVPWHHRFGAFWLQLGLPTVVACAASWLKVTFSWEWPSSAAMPPRWLSVALGLQSPDFSACDHPGAACWLLVAQVCRPPTTSG